MSLAVYAILVVPLVATVLAAFSSRVFAHAVTVAASVAALGLAIALAAAVRHGRVLEAAGGWLRIDALGAVFLLATALLYAAAAVFSIGYLQPSGSRQADAGSRRAGSVRPHGPGYVRLYCALLNLFCATMLFVPLTAGFGLLWVAVELTTVVSVLLVAIDRTKGALEAAWKYVLIASVGLFLALLAVLVLYAAGTHAIGSAYVPRFTPLLAHARGLTHEAVELAFVLALVGFGTKAGFAPMHTWLPDAHSEAPAPVSALLSGSLLADALYAVLRFFQVALANGDRAFAEHVLIVFGVVSLVLAALSVLRQRNFKRLLAYSSIEHMGVIALGIGFGAPLAVAGALLHVITHASTKGLAFFGTGSLMRGYQTRRIGEVTDAGRRMPFTGPMFLAAALALSGLPLSGIFRSEFEIAVGGFTHGQYVGAGLLIVLVNLAFFGVVWHIGMMVLRRPNGPAGSQRPPRTLYVAPLAGGARSGVAPVGRDTAGFTEALPTAAGRVAESQVGERSVFMVVAMAACLFVVVALGVHLPGELSMLLASARHVLEVGAA